MGRLSSSSFADRIVTAAFAALVGLTMSSPARGQTAPRDAGAGVPSLLSQALAAETDLRLPVAIDRLYELLIEHPGTADALTARLRMARLLALSGSVPQALLQCQLLRDELPADDPRRTEALELATLLGRRLRASQSGQAYFAAFESVPARGVQTMDESRAIVFENDGRFVLFDEGAGRVYRVAGESASMLTAPQDPTAVAVMPDGSIAIAGKTGLATIPASRVVTFSGSWGGKARQARKVRSMAAFSDGSLLVIDRDFDGVLKCQFAAGVCAQWGPPGKFRVVRVGPTGWVYLLDDRGQSIRVLDASQRQITLVGSTAGAGRIDKVEDIAVDGGHGLYLLDKDLKQLLVYHLKAQPDGRIAAALTSAIAIPQEGDRAMKNPTAVGVSPSGQVYLAGKSSARVMRWR